MDDLFTRLRAALGDRYTIERVLGRGGMATVYLAHDRKHDRQVAIKVLKPELAAALGPERFVREIEIAARLTHPHILPLHDSGEAAGLLYYVMPYVEGESLRQRLVREKQLPLEDALQITGEVASALSYAHSHDVVHRDIKPENILLSGGEAVVADFGIARAITAAGGDKLTTTGVAVGTPTYMSPEQAAGSAQLDGRSDVYSLGCVLYEMLAGEPPFTGASAQAVMAAQITANAKPLTSLRRDTPPEVAEAITRALAKDPNTRFQTAAQFRDAIGRDTAAAGRRGEPMRVAALYGIAAGAVFSGVYGLTIELGLPTWVSSGAAVLLIIGLPIMVATGVLERRRAVARAAGARVPAMRGLPGWLTWRRALAGGGLAFGALGVGVTGYMTMRVLGIGPPGTLLGSGVIKDREPLILAGFENRSPDSTLGPSLTAAFQVDLSESRTVRLVDAAAIAAALRRMERPVTTTLDLTLARELAQRENVKGVVRGEIDPLGKGYVLSASLVAATDGHMLIALRETADNDAALIGAVDRLSRRLRERIGESLKAIRAGPPLEQVTTASLDALRKYSEGARAELEDDYERAAASYRAAATIDTAFAMAYRKLATVLWNARASDSAVAAAAAQAFRHRDRLPKVERYLATAQYYEMADYDGEKAASAYHSVLEEDPENAVALNNLIFLLYQRRQWREAESLAVRGLRQPGANPLFSSTFLGHAAMAQIGQGRYADAEATLDRFAQVAPRGPLLPWARFFVEAARGDYVAAERVIRQLRAEERGIASWQAVSESGLAWLDEVRGHLAEAARELDASMATAERRHLASDYLTAAIWRARMELRYRHRPLAGARVVEAALARHPLSSMPLWDRPYPELAAFNAEAGRPELATRLLAEYERLVPERIRRGHPERLAARGAIALAEGRVQDAILAYRAWTDEARLATDGLFELATAYERAGQLDSAVVVLERAASTPGRRTPFLGYGGRDVGLAHAIPATFAHLGALYETRGNRAKAREYYGRFVDLWKDADPELQAVVRDVRARLARLAGEH